ncbi:uncharacterized protein EV420DRAFT_1640145 [Desarmillaria tabescens]|uniref:Uncharacterized protein n=1 Tax=Armillaria tabescens TaxID=1929756 RepID=A0AA39NA46_ARMTA|nr:uncharacterized protein EV420DRAFT_1640145 [Desarmillaria tabescens]KAK0461840.1 hypothetical protein EV420DRAFT_1640145 [Desarmillaria tabescens]
MNYDSHINEVTIYDTTLSYSQLYFTVIHTIQWRHWDARWTSVSEVLDVTPAVDTLIFRDTYVHGQMSVLGTAIRDVALINCRVTHQALSGLLVPDRGPGDFRGQNVIFYMWYLKPEDGNQLFAWLTTSVKGVRDLILGVELDVDISIVQGFLNRWCKTLQTIKIKQIVTNTLLWGAGLLRFYGCQFLTALEIRCLDSEIGLLTRSLVTVPPAQLRTLTIGFQVTLWAEEKERRCGTLAVQRFDACTFDLVKHYEFEFLKIVLGYNYMDDRESEYFVDGFLITNLNRVKTLPYKKWDYAFYHITTSRISELIQESNTVPWFEYWIEAKKLMSLDSTTGCLSPGSANYDNTPAIIREHLERVTHVTIVLACIPPDTKHNCIASLSHILVEWASANLGQSVTLHGLAYEVIDSPEQPYVAATMLVRAEHLCTITDSAKSIAIMGGIAKVHEAPSEDILTIRSFSNAIRTAW